MRNAQVYSLSRNLKPSKFNTSPLMNACSRSCIIFMSEWNRFFFELLVDRETELESDPALPMERQMARPPRRISPQDDTPLGRR